MKYFPSLLFTLACFLMFMPSTVFPQNGFIDAGIDGTVFDLEVQPDGKIVIGGSFRNVAGMPRRGIGRLNSNGSIDTTFQDPVLSGTSVTVSDVLRLADGKVMIAGIFNGVGGHPTRSVARLNADGTVDTSFLSVVEGYAAEMVLQSDGKFLVAGSFSVVGGLSRQGVARLNADGTVDTTFQDPQVTSSASQVESIVLQPDGKILIGGWFTSVGGTSRSYLARLLSNGALDTSFSAQVSGPVSMVQSHSTGAIFIAGYFQTVNASPRNCFAKLTGEGELDQSLQSPTNNGNITTFAIQSDGKILIGGAFTEFGGIEHRSFARINSDGSYDPSFPDPNRNFGGTFYSIYPIVIQSDGKILVGGDFNTIGHLPRRGVVRFNADGTLDTPSETLTVTKTADTNDGTCDADCSLREAVTRANVAPETTVITFDPTVFSSPQTITLTLGEISLNSRINIVGPGRDILTISGNDASRIFVVERDAIVSIDGVTLSNGRAISAVFSGEGGAIWVQPNGVITRLELANTTLKGNEGTLVGAIGTFNNSVAALRDVLFENNRTTATNGGVAAMHFRGEELLMERVTVRNNVCVGIACSGGVTAAGATTILDSVFDSNSGRALQVSGTATIAGTQIVNNTGGGLQTSGFQEKTIRDSLIAANTTTGNGGGVSNENAAKLTIINTTISRNQAEHGAGVFTVGNLSLERVSFVANLASGSGGAIYNNASLTTIPVVVTNSFFGMNSASAAGGAIYNRDRIEITASNFDGNTTGVNGGGIFNASIVISVTATVSVQSSSFTRNEALSGTGGGICNQGTKVVLLNSTFSANRALSGGGVRNSTGEMSLFHITVAENRATSSGAGVSNSALLTSRSSLFANNLNTASGSSGDFSGTLESEGYNLLASSTGALITGNTAGNLLNVPAGIGPFGGYGGSTGVHPLAAGSPAIDAADPVVYLSADQRGAVRPVDGNGDGVARADIGAFEVRTRLVSNTNDNGPGSLRQTIVEAFLGDAIIFDPAIFVEPTTIALTGGELRIASGFISIGGPGADRLTLDAGNASRIFTVAPAAGLVLSDITLANGNGVGLTDPYLGGAISSRGDLSIFRTVIRDSSAFAEGGGIAVLSGTLKLTASTLHDNHAQNGGALYFSHLAWPGSAVTNSTLSGNTAVSGGGAAVISAPSVSFDFVTVASNTTTNGNGGGIYVTASGSVTSSNTIYADNVAQGSGTSPDVHGTIMSSGYNLIENTTGSQITGTTNGNQLGVDPKLGPLANNGGTTPVKPLRFRSPAIDTANPTVYLLRDQIGRVRPLDGDGNSNARSDIGAVEFDPSVDATGSTAFDFDGDGRADVGVYRPVGGEWWLLNSGSGNTQFGYTQFGLPTDILTPADFTGDGITDISVFRPEDGVWYVKRSEIDSYFGFQFGGPGDIPAPADYDGDGKADAAVFRPSEGLFFIFQSSDLQVRVERFGTAGDQPLSGDFDGDGKADIALWRESTGEWFVLKSSGGFAAVQFGLPGDKAIPADFTGDGITDIAVWRPSETVWYVIRSENGSYYGFPFGLPTDKPIPADYDGDGRADPTIYRPETGEWFSMRTTDGISIIQWGTGDDRPVPGAFVR